MGFRFNDAISPSKFFFLIRTNKKLEKVFENPKEIFQKVWRKDSGISFSAMISFQNDCLKYF